MKNSESKKDKPDVIIQVIHNRKASFDYTLSDKFEAGIVLTGNEIKSIRGGGISIAEAYVRVMGNAAFLVGAHVNPYAFSSEKDYDPIRARKLLLNEAELNKLRGAVSKKGLTIVPVRMYIKNGRAKLEIALAKHKNAPDKRKDIISKEKKRDAERAMKGK